MLKLFKRKKKGEDDASIRRRPYLQELDWPFFTKLRINLNPFSGRLFFHHIVCMVSKMATVDGAVSEIELRVFTELLEREFSLKKKQVKRARAILFQAHRSKKAFSDFAREFYRHFKNQPAVLENALDVLLAMAYSDNFFSISEQRIMAEAAEIFKVPTEELTRLVKRYHKHTSKIEKPGEEKRAEQKKQKQQSAENESRRSHEEKRQNEKKEQSSHQQKTHAFFDTTEENSKRTWFMVLGCTPFDSASQVKKRYRELVRAYHPDKLPQGIPDEMKRASTERFLEIQRAYEHYINSVVK